MDDLTKFLIPLFVVFVGWVVTHFFSMDRDRKNKKRDLKTKYLIDAFQRLERNVWNKNPVYNEVEGAMADIQLFG
jgi:hypothetical protein